MHTSLGRCRGCAVREEIRSTGAPLGKPLISKRCSIRSYSRYIITYNVHKAWESIHHISKPASPPIGPLTHFTSGGCGQGCGLNSFS